MRVGIDQTFGGWNATVDPTTRNFVYLPIPDGAQRLGLETRYSAIEPALSRFPGISLPSSLATRATHLDPDFEYLIVDSTVVRAHQHAAGAKKGGLKIRPLVVHAGV